MSIFSKLKEKIVEGALEQFLKHGMRSMTSKKLIEPMGISNALSQKRFTFFRRLPSSKHLPVSRI